MAESSSKSRTNSETQITLKTVKKIPLPSNNRISYSVSNLPVEKESTERQSILIKKVKTTQGESFLKYKQLLSNNLMNLILNPDNST